jgi:hypothetical protein
VGLCHLVTAAGLRPAATSGRVLLGLGGAGTLAVAACPLPADYGSFAAHGVAAGVAFGALACWPVLSTSGPDRSAGPVTRRPAGRRLPFGLRRPVALAAGGLLLGLLGWFVSQLDGPVLGLSERVAAGAQALWPAVVVLTCLVHRPAAPDDDPATRGDGPSARRLWITPAVE